MNNELKKKWIDALRSGKYIQDQTQSLLKTVDNKFCCLGVLCDVHDSDAWSVPDRYPSYSGCCTYLSEDMLNVSGLTNKQQIELARMNDTGTSFHDIADYIEKNL